MANQPASLTHRPPGPIAFTRREPAAFLAAYQWHTKHVTYKLASHFVWCPKYRKKILVGKFAAFVEQELRRICVARQWSVGALNVQPDHVHLFLSAPPPVAPSEIAHQLKGATARKVFQCFPEVKKQLWGGAFWSRSYYVGSV